MRDPMIEKASQQAQATFKYLWRELSWEYRRIIPGLDSALVKVPFATPQTDDSMPPEEFMWMSDIEFDGEQVSGVLVNSPNWAMGVKEGDEVRVPLNRISDWMYVFNGKAYGAYTVNGFRALMDDAERQAHDEAWGLDFGDPDVIELTPYPQDEAEHPMSVNLADNIRQSLEEQPELTTSQDESGWTLLQREALAGNVTPVKLLLEFGADPQETNPAGESALTLATKMGWDEVAAVLRAQS